MSDNWEWRELCGNKVCAFCLKGVAAPQLQSAAFVQEYRFSAARFQFFKGKQKSGFIYKNSQFRKQYVGQEGITVAGCGPWVVSLQPLCSMCSKGC